jgi:hypothetical protein
LGNYSSMPLQKGTVWEYLMIKDRTLMESGTVNTG